MKYSPTMMHAVSDYVMGALLLAAPWIFGFWTDLTAMFCTMAFGATTIAYSLFTDYELSVKRVIPMVAHLTLDAASGGLLIAAPFLMNFAGTTWVPHLVIGCVEVGMAIAFALFLGFFRLNGQPRTQRGRRVAH
jgi:hypothetical protein